ncbi:hypothetical protein THAR02_05316 [Trichoderma harzianum]|uniref:Uncharacterized protein n=1 Tax=Trichoderma harzianum TaxID=5544 RepID=A0A0G0AC90_TRIHA|nr:hypothetical protein THAR02_05316 [Trichoderma harzianum]
MLLMKQKQPANGRAKHLQSSPVQPRHCIGSNQIKSNQIKSRPHPRLGRLMRDYSPGADIELLYWYWYWAVLAPAALVLSGSTAAAQVPALHQPMPGSQTRPPKILLPLFHNKGEAQAKVVNEPPAFGHPIANGLSILILIAIVHRRAPRFRPVSAPAPVWRPGDACRGERRQLRKTEKNKERGLASTARDTDRQTDGQTAGRRGFAA